MSSNYVQSRLDVLEIRTSLRTQGCSKHTAAKQLQINLNTTRLLKCNANSQSSSNGHKKLVGALLTSCARPFGPETRVCLRALSRALTEKSIGVKEKPPAGVLQENKRLDLCRSKSKGLRALPGG